MLALAAATAAAPLQAACTRVNPADDVIDHVASLPNFDLPGSYYSGGSYKSVLADAFDCPAGQPYFIVELSFPALSYEREVVAERETYAGYSLGERSPLIGFGYVAGPDSSGAVTEPVPLRVGQTNRVPGGATGVARAYGAGLYVQAFFRGGAMESVPRTLVGTAVSWPEDDPSQRLQHVVTVQFNVPPLSCVLSQASLTLGLASADDLPAPGSSSGEADLEVAMNCPSANVDVTFTVADAQGNNRADGVLTPAAGSTGSGVQVQLLRGGAPLPLGVSWRHGYSAKGLQAIPFSARYLRTADPILPGDIKGEALLTAEYR
ncbi:fimbrial protein [Stenotrophomonas sp. ZAC14D2_NAIMI4_7]|uniref:fimbrial protein n=1 Tax=Stenotrophomonas sp. ZAC14D2_NAIMI4_7 TaxID=2072405 RepID=UPI001F232A56|nr:fimbrial protein [Stenotrophomonas sp. ZAC14D2_NAIMI4_7]